MPATRKRTRESSRIAKQEESEHKRLKNVDTNVVVKIEELSVNKVEINNNDNNDNPASDDDAEEFSGISEFEKRRLKNLKENAEFFAQLGIFKAKEELYALTNTPPRPKTVFKEKKKVVRERLPRRSSLRIQRIDPEGQPLPEMPVQAPVEEHPPKPNPLPFHDSVISDTATDGVDAFLTSFKKISKHYKRCPVTEDTRSQQSLCKALSSIRLTEDRVTKVVRNRSFSLAVHPSTSKLLVCSGDKWGQLGFWDVDTSATVTFAPHSRPINCLQYSPNDDCRLLSASYDGTVKCMDLNSTQFVEVYKADEFYSLRATHFDFLSPQTIVVSLGDGSIVVKDLRSDDSGTEHELGQYTVKTVHSHPVDKHYIVTAANTCMAVWDLRYMRKKNSKCLDSVTSSRTVSSAYFSPITGKHIVSATMEDKTRVHSFAGKELKQEVSFRHNNHTGRWLTVFRPTWHPLRDDVFVSGSMDRPRQIELFNVKGEMVKSFKSEWLGSICSVNVFHPTLDILAAVNSSGRIHVFK